MTTQYDEIISRTENIKPDVLKATANKITKMFEGMDTKMLKAAKQYSEAVTAVNARHDLSQQGKKEHGERLRQELYDPVKNQYLTGLEEAIKVVNDGVSKITDELKPRSDTGADRAINLIMWEKEIAASRGHKLHNLILENADDMDFTRLVAAMSNIKPDAAEYYALKKMELIGYTECKEMRALRRFLENCRLCYTYSVSAHLREIANGDIERDDVRISHWNHLEKYERTPDQDLPYLTLG
jgi:hypothetical protein